MPELCRFYNIVIKMLYSDNTQHYKPHFHTYYAEYEAWNKAERNEPFGKIEPLR